MIMNFRDCDTFLFDIDNTLTLWPGLLDGSKKVIQKLVNDGRKILYLTDSTAKPQIGLARHMTSLGIETKPDQVINPGYVISNHFKNKKIKVLAFGDGLKSDLKKFGIKMKNKFPVDYVIIADDFSFNYDKLSLAINAVLNGAKLITCSLGRLRFEKNRIIAGTSSIAAGIQHATQKEMINFGKPSDYTVRATLEKIKNPRKTVMIGDSIESDVAFAKKLKCFSVLIASNNKKIPDRLRPTLRISSIKEFYNFI